MQRHFMILLSNTKDYMRTNALLTILLVLVLYLCFQHKEVLTLQTSPKQ